MINADSAGEFGRFLLGKCVVKSFFFCRGCGRRFAAEALARHEPHCVDRDPRARNYQPQESSLRHSIAARPTGSPAAPRPATSMGSVRQSLPAGLPSGLSPTKRRLGTAAGQARPALPSGTGAKAASVSPKKPVPRPSPAVDVDPDVPPPIAASSPVAQGRPSKGHGFGFCVECGTPFPVASAKFCMECGTKNAKNAN